MPHDQSTCSFDAANARHPHIHQHQVGLFNRPAIQDFFTADCNIYALNSRNQSNVSTQSFTRHGSVITHENRGHEQPAFPQT
jgi:hypothetical protein